MSLELLVAQYGTPVGLLMGFVWIITIMKRIQQDVTEIKRNITWKGECDLLHERVNERLDTLEGRKK